RQIPDKISLIASYVDDNYVVDQTAYIAKPKSELNILFYLGVLNSKLLFWYFRNVNNEFDRLFPKIKISEFRSLPLPLEKYTDEEISTLVSQVIELKTLNINTSDLESKID